MAEGLVRKLPPFSRFLRAMALSNGAMLNFTKLASDCQVPPSTVSEYVSLLEDSLVGHLLPPWTASKKTAGESGPDRDARWGAACLALAELSGRVVGAAVVVKAGMVAVSPASIFKEGPNSHFPFLQGVSPRFTSSQAPCVASRSRLSAGSPLVLRVFQKEN